MWTTSVCPFTPERASLATWPQTPSHLIPVTCRTRQGWLSGLAVGMEHSCSPTCSPGCSEVAEEAPCLLLPSFSEELTTAQPWPLRGRASATESPRGSELGKAGCNGVSPHSPGNLGEAQRHSLRNCSSRPRQHNGHRTGRVARGQCVSRVPQVPAVTHFISVAAPLSPQPAQVDAILYLLCNLCLP